MLKNRVKKSLMEIKENKEKQLIGESLIKNRLTIILEGINSEKDFKSLSEKKQIALSVKFIKEMNYLTESGLIKEDVNLGGLLKSIFGSNLLGSATQTIVEPYINSILSSLGFENGFIKNFLISYLTSRPSDVIKSFSDCKLMTKLISTGIVEAVVMTTQRNKGYRSFGNDLIRNILGNVLDSNEFVQGIENGLSGKICSILGKFTDNTKKVVSTLKGSV
jgi:hypothetical protein